MKNKFIIIQICCLALNLFFTTPAYGQLEIPSSFNPVGSGARAIGIGGAFIAVADDATAASWNPGGLTQLRKPEFSMVMSGFYRGEDIEFGTNPEGNGYNSIAEENINYLSVVYPFELFDYNMIVSLSYQHLFDFTREWEFMLKGVVGPTTYEDRWDYKQNGRLSALGISYCIQLIPEHLSMGFTLNIWNDNLTDNKWEKKYYKSGSGELYNIPVNDPYVSEYQKTEAYSFRGINANIGFLWDINRKISIGAVLKTPFIADITYERQESSQVKYPEDPHLNQPPFSGYYTRNEELKMPLSYGIGVVYHHSDDFSISADIYKTEWNNFIYKKEDGEEISPISGIPSDESEIEPTHQVRIGAEYLFFKEKQKKIVVPIRWGLFYDPAPAEGSPDDFYGFSLGIGFTKNNRFSLDIAYQYRFGNNVASYTYKGMGFSQDVDEHMLYLSTILYSF